jgi:hypothetical protein
MFNERPSTIGTVWCSWMHRSVTWPVHGYYECRACHRRYPAFAEAPVARRSKRAALKLAASLALALVLALLVHPLHSAELQPSTLTAWNAYRTEADSRVEERATGRLPFLWMDESPERAARVRNGEVVVAPVVAHGSEAVPHGLIHDWIGVIFIPGATLDSLWAAIHNYDNYQSMYRPVVTSSQTLACTEDSQEFQMVWQRKVLFISAAMRGHYQAHEVMLDPHRGYNVAEAVEIREIQGYGHKDERMLPPDTGNGFIWRIRSVARYEERDGGVYLELEAAALTRDIPASLAWMVNPVVNHLSINSLTTTLRQTRDAVISSRGNHGSLALCPLPNRGSQIAKAGGE